MTNRKHLAVLTVLALVQLSVLFYMVCHWESVAVRGQVVKWIIKPVDPYDFMRGRYIHLDYEKPYGPWLDSKPGTSGDRVYVLLDEKSPLAQITGVTRQKPEHGLFVRANLGWMDEQGQVHVRLPFYRYYMPEDLAPAAEKAYRRTAKRQALAQLRIRDGYVVVEDILLDGVPIYTYLQNNIPQPPTSAPTEE